MEFEGEACAVYLFARKAYSVTRARNVQKHPYRYDLPMFDDCIARYELVVRIALMLLVTTLEVAPDTRSSEFGESFIWREVPHLIRRM